MDDNDTMLTAVQVAKKTGRSTTALAQDRWRDRGLPFVRLGRNIRYLRSDVDAYIEQNRVVPTNKSA